MLLAVYIMVLRDILAATIKSTGIPADAKYEYQLAATQDSNQLSEDRWLSECPVVVNVADSGQYVFVRGYYR